MPNLLHIIPVRDNTVFNRVLQSEDTTLRLRFVADVSVLLRRAHHDTGVARTSDNGREHSAGSIITRETGLHHTGAVVNDQSLNFVVAHCVRSRLEKRMGETAKEIEMPETNAFLEIPM